MQRKLCHASEGWHPVFLVNPWMPAFAGMTQRWHGQCTSKNNNQTVPSLRYLPCRIAAHWAMRSHPRWLQYCSSHN